MSARYILAPEAVHDLVDIWRYIKDQSSLAMADRVESVIRDKIAFLSQNPGAGHWRRSLQLDTGDPLFYKHEEISRNYRRKWP